jgi:hypothetical protein
MAAAWWMLASSLPSIVVEVEVEAGDHERKFWSCKADGSEL